MVGPGRQAGDGPGRAARYAPRGVRSWRHWLWPAFAAVLLLGAPSWTAAQARLRVGRVEGVADVVIDGKVDDGEWAAAPAYSGFTQQEPDEGQPATERTVVRFMLDRRHLYVGIEIGRAHV